MSPVATSTAGDPPLAVASTPLLTVRAASRAWADRDEVALREQLDEDVRWSTAVGSPYAGTRHGRSAVVELLRRTAVDWPRWDVEVEMTAGAGEQVVAIGTYRGRAAKTGRSVETRFAQLWAVRDGRVVGYEEIVDASRLMAPLIPAQPSIP
jgi:ketosteroid isomerase-like protein